MDIQRMVAELTDERDRLTRAIDALTGVTAAAPRKEKQWTPISAATKAQIVARLKAADREGEALAPIARQLSAQYGISSNTVKSHWRKWDIALRKVNGQAGEPTAVSDVETIA